MKTERRYSGRQLISFGDLAIGEYFVLAYEIKYNPIFKYTPMLKKTGESSYEYGNAMMNDTRRVYKDVRIHGSVHPNAGVYRCVTSGSNFVTEKWLK